MMVTLVRFRPTGIKMGVPSRNRRKAKRQESNMHKSEGKSGIWLKVNYAEGESLNKMSAEFVAAVNKYRNNPNPETESEMNAKGKVFKDAWRAIK